MTDRERTLDLIKKLLAKADSAAQLGSAAEAATFAAKANELLLKHKLEMTDLEVSAEEVADPIGEMSFDPTETLRWVGRGRRAAWLESLVSAVARAHFCRIIVHPGSKRVSLVGRPHDVAIVKYLIQVLAREAERLAVLYEREVRVEAKRAGLPIPEAPKRGFLLGFVRGVREKLAEMRAQVQHQGGQFALVRFERAESAVVKYMESLRLSSAGGLGGSSFSTNKSAWEAGRRAGQRQSLHGGVGSGPDTRNSTLSSGSKLLGGGK